MGGGGPPHDILVIFIQNGAILGNLMSTYAWIKIKRDLYSDVYTILNRI